MKNKRKKVISTSKPNKLLLTLCELLLILTMATSLLTGCTVDKEYTNDKEFDNSSDMTQADNDNKNTSLSDYEKAKAIREEYLNFDLNSKYNIRDVMNAISEVSDVVKYLEGLGIDEIYNNYVTARQNFNGSSSSIKKINLGYSKLALTVVKAQILDGIDNWNIAQDSNTKFTPKDNPNADTKLTVMGRNEYGNRVYKIDVKFSPINKTINGGIEVNEAHTPVTLSEFEFVNHYSNVDFMETVLNIQNGKMYSVEEIDNYVKELLKSLGYIYEYEPGSIDWDNNVSPSYELEDTTAMKLLMELK